jgi:hypothetical protein
MKKSLALWLSGMLLFSLSCALFGPRRGPLQFEPDALPAAQVGSAYEAKVSISDNATPAGQFSVPEGALPPGLTLETLQGKNTARIYGTPTQAGTYKFKIFVWCYGTNISGQTGEKQYTLVVK